MGRDDLDLYDSGADRSSVGHMILRILGFLVGVGLGFVGVVLYTLRCFDTCPADPAVNAISQLLTGAMMLTGLAIVIEAMSFRTTWTPIAEGAVIVVGALIAVAGIASLALIPSVEGTGGGAGTVGFALLAVAVGAALMVNSVRERRAYYSHASPKPD